MPDVVSTADIQEYIDHAIPATLETTKGYFFALTDALLNHSKATSLFQFAIDFYDPFEGEVRVSPLMLYDKKLAKYLHRDISGLIALSLMDEGPSFFTQFFATFFDSFAVYYSDRNENKYEPITGLISTDQGFVTDDNTFTDEGVGQGVHALLAEIYFHPLELDDIRDKMPDVVNLMMIMKPGRLHCFIRPSLAINVNELMPDDPQYDPELVTGDTAVFSSPVAVYPDILATDADPVWLTDGSPPIPTDNVSTEDFLASLTNLNVKYASDPLVVVQVPLTVTLFDKGESILYVGDGMLDGNIVEFALSGASIPITAEVVKDIFVPEQTNDTADMRVRIQWTVPKGSVSL